MKLATEPYDEPQKDHGISRMILLSAVLHVVVIGALLVTGYFRPAKPNKPQVTSYEVSLVGPTGTGKRQPAGESAPVPPRQATVEKPIALPAKGEQREVFPPKPQEKPEPEAQPKPQEPPAEKPREIAKKIEPPKPQPTPVVKEKEPPKVVAAVKPVEKKPPPPAEKKIAEAKAEEPVKPKVEARLSEKKEKPKEKPPLQSERVKVQEKKPEVRKTEENPKGQPPPPKPEKKPQEPVKTTAKEKVSETKKTENTDAPQKRPAVAVPVAKATPSVDATQEREEEEARNNLIASALERVRTREEAVNREQDIAKAVNRVRQGVGGQEENGRETEKKPAAANTNDEKGDGQLAKAKVYGPEFLAYTEDIKQKVKEGWIVVDRKPGLTAVVRFGVEADGEVIDVELAESSGDRSFDQSALRAVKNAKLPPPPETYREDFVTQKVHMTFGGEE